MKQSMPDGVDVDKKLSDYAIKIVPNVSSAVLSGITEWYPIVFEAIISANTDSKTYKVWVYNRAMGTLNDITSKDNIFMRVEYIKAYDDSSEYVIGYSESTQIDIANAASSSDWDYLEVAAVAPATTNKIRVTIYLNAYHATGMIYIDPQVVIS